MNKETINLILRIIIAVATAISAVFGFTSCGMTKAVVDKPAEGTSTTITITTNNPMTTTVNPNTNAEFLNK